MAPVTHRRNAETKAALQKEDARQDLEFAVFLCITTMIRPVNTSFKYLLEVFMLNCYFISDVNYNDTYLQNPDYPSTYSETNSISYTINKVDKGNNALPCVPTGF